VLSSLFGDKLGGVVGAVSGASGVSQTTGQSILAMAAPAVMGLLGKQVSSGGLGASGLVNLLLSNKDAIARAAPAGLAGALGLRSLGDLGGRTIQAVQQGAAGATSATRRWLPLVAVAAALLIAYLAVRGFGEPAKDTASQLGTGGSAMVRKMTSVALPGGGSLSVEQDTFLYNLSHYLGNTSDTAVPKTFTFENLNFESGGTTLTPASNATVSDLTRVLQAYPNAQVKLVGYTDATGDVPGNKALSLARAKAVGDLLSRGGVAQTRITTDGLGEENPVAPNNTDEGRAKNRRIELVVTQK
jgi:outer membrane protein OmpA-like peptidoglycan-associated protein